MRTAFIQQLILEARLNPRIFLAVGDLGYSVVEPFVQEFPNRFLNAGVAEQNMTGVAAGLASEGYHVFTYSIANFPTLRCAEQIRNDIAYHGLSVTVVSVGGGLAYGNLGYSHHAVQDLAVMRSFPGLTLACPGDPAEARAAVRFLTNNPCPSYLRLGKAGEPVIHSEVIDIALNRLVPLRTTGEINLILTTGATLKLASDSLAQIPHTNYDLASLPLWSEAGKDELVAQLRRYRKIVTIEDHLHAGGFGSFVREALLAADVNVQVKSVALSSAVCGEVASQAALNRLGGLSVETILSALQDTCGL